jgi:transcriptional regulator with XRE-family HTH domain
MDDERAYAKTQADLATALGVSKQTIGSWVRRHDRPKKHARYGYHIDTWKRWMHEKNLGKRKSDEHLTAKEREDLAKAIHWELRVQKEQDLLFPRDDVKREWSQKIQEAIKLLRSKFLTEMPPELVGLSAVEIREANEKALDQVFEILSRE